MDSRNRRMSAISVAAVLAVAIAAPAAAQDGEADHLQRILDKNIIVMSTDPLYPPQSFLDDAGEIVGFDLDVGAAIAGSLVSSSCPRPRRGTWWLPAAGPTAWTSASVR